MSSEPESAVQISAQYVARIETRRADDRWIDRWRLRKREAAPLELRWLRGLISLLVLGIVLAFVANPAAAFAGQLITIGAGVLMSVYFAHLLLFRLQMSLLEGCVLVALLGNCEGLLLTMSGIRAVGYVWLSLLVPMIAAWILYGAVKGLMQAELLMVTAPLKRALLIISGVFTVAAPAMVVSGGVIWHVRDDNRLISPNMAAWALPLIVLGCIGLALRVRLGLLTRRAAYDALVNPPAHG